MMHFVICLSFVSQYLSYLNFVYYFAFLFFLHVYALYSSVDISFHARGDDSAIGAKVVLFWIKLYSPFYKLCFPYYSGSKDKCHSLTLQVCLSLHGEVVSTSSYESLGPGSVPKMGSSWCIAHPAVHPLVWVGQ